MYNWITLLYTWNYHNTVNQLYSNIKLKIKKQNKKSCNFCLGLSFLGCSRLEPGHHIVKVPRHVERPHTGALVTASADSQRQLSATWMRHLGCPTLSSPQITAAQLHLTATAQAHACPDNPSQPAKAWEIIINYCFKPLSFGVIFNQQTDKKSPRTGDIGKNQVPCPQ